LNQRQLDALDADLRSFHLNYQAGRRTVEELISTESLRTRHHISSAVSKLESSINLNTAEVRNSANDIKCHVSETLGTTITTTIATFSKSLHDLHLDEKRQDRRDRLLRSLKFPGMNERRQQVPESFPQTFQWAFGNEAAEKHEDSRDRDSNDASGKVHSSESNELRRLRRYQFVSQSVICETPWDDFGEWLRSGSSVYWISGKPGSGKTTLVKY
jgi:hypothetical protein